MKRILKIGTLIIAGLVAIFFVSKFVRSLTVTRELTSLDTEHFKITYKGIYERNALAVSKELEANYDRIRAELDDPEHDLIEVFIHSNQQEFNKATGLFNSSANGTSRGPDEFHFIWTNWFNSILPDNPNQTAIHEFTHCVQLNVLIREAIQTMDYENEESFNEIFEKKFLADYPQWFWEAICTYEAEEVNRISVKFGMSGDPTLQQLNSSNQIYNVGYTIIEYFIDEWGSEKLPEFIRSYCDFEQTLGVTEAEFEQGWKKFVDQQY